MCFGAKTFSLDHVRTQRPPRGTPPGLRGDGAGEGLMGEDGAMLGGEG